MQKNTHIFRKRRLTKFLAFSLRATLVIIFFTTLGSISISAHGYSQERLTIELKNVKLSKVFEVIQKSTDYQFLYNVEDVQQAPDLSVSVRNATVQEVMELCFKDYPLDYRIKDKTVLVLRRQKKSSNFEVAVANRTAIPAITINGRVTDSKGQPLEAVSISVKGTTSGTSTNKNGAYTITAPEDGVLIFSFIGYISQEVPVNNRRTINISMEQETQALSEVVVTSFGIQRDKKTLGYGVASIKSEDLNNAPTSDVTNALAGKVAGVQVAGSGGGFASSNITIRGFSSITRSNQPLYVIDGVPIDNGGGGNSVNQGVANSSRVADVNPEDIESMSVLKGAAATVLYGSRAASGVILITTKKGRSGKTQVSLISNSSMGTVNKFPEYQNEYAQGTQGMYGDATDPLRWVARSTSWGPRIAGQKVKNILGEEVTLQAYPDNVRDILQHSQQYDNTLSFSGGADKYNYRVSYGNNYQTALVPENVSKRNNFTVNAGAKISEKLRMNTSFSYVNNRSNRTQAGNQGANPLWRAIYAPRSYDVTGLPVTDPQGNQIWYSTSEENPYWSIKHITRQFEANRFYGNINLNYQILSWLQADLKIGVDAFSFNSTGFDDKGVRSNANTASAGKGGLVESQTLTRNLNSYFTFSGNRTYGDFNLAATLGNEIISNYSKSISTTGLSITLPGFANLKNFNTFSSTNGYEQTRLTGFFGDISVDYKTFLNLNLKARNDFASTLSPENRSIFYPAVAVSFVLTEAFPNLRSDALNFAKIRANVGEVGKGAGAYSTDTYWVTAGASDGFSSTAVNFPFNNLVGYTYSNTAGNYNIKPEFTREIEIGTEMSFFNRRLSLDLSVYKRDSRDLIFAVPVPTSSGFSSQIKNAGRLSTKGIEFLLTGVPVKRGNFSWESTLNFTSFKSMVEELAPGVSLISLGGFTSPNIQAVAGKQYGLIYSNRYVRDDQGRMIIKANGLPQVTSSVGEVGNPNPKFTAGFSNTLKYKNLSMSFLIDAKYKGDVMSRTIGDLRINGVVKETAKYDRFNKDGTLATPWLFEGVHADGTPNTTYVTAQDYWGLAGKYVAWEGYVLDASFIKLREVSFNYAFSKGFLERTKLITRLELSVYGRNLLTYAPNYPHLDPEQNLLGISNARGLEFGIQPVARTVGVSVKAAF